METKHKKGFRPRNLVIVVALSVLVILCIFFLISHILKYHIEDDGIRLVRNLNMAVEQELEATGRSRYDTMYDALKACEKRGYLVDTIVSKSNYEIAWESTTGRFVLLKMEEGKAIRPISARDQCVIGKHYSAETFSIDTSNAKGSEHKALDYFVVTPASEYDGTTNAFSERYRCYSVYAYGSEWQEYVFTDKGFDAGETEGITSVGYTHDSEGERQDVIIRTNGGTLTVNAPRDDVSHYGYVEYLTVTAVRSDHCYHEFGFVGSLVSFGTGKFVVESSALFHQTMEQVAAKFVNADTYAAGVAAQYSQHFFDENGVCVVENCDDGTGHKVTNDKHNHSFNEKGECVCGETEVLADIEIFGIDPVIPYYFVGDRFTLSSNVPGVIWSSGDESKVKINASTGELECIETVQYVTITAKKGDRAKSATITVWPKGYVATPSTYSRQVVVGESEWVLIASSEVPDIKPEDPTVAELSVDTSHNHVKYMVKGLWAGKTRISYPYGTGTSFVTVTVESHSFDFTSGQTFATDIENWIGCASPTTVIFDYNGHYPNVVNGSLEKRIAENATVYWDPESKTLYVLAESDIALPKNLESMFVGFANVKTIELMNFDLSAGSYNVSGMFNGCVNLERIYVSDDLVDWSCVATGNEIFLDCRSLTVGDGTLYSDLNQIPNYLRSNTADHARVGAFGENLYGAFSVKPTN